MWSSATSRCFSSSSASALFFQLPLRGSLLTLLVALGVFIAGNLALGITFSTVSANQMQAMQFAQFTLMPSFMLSGFMFPFRGMPVWAQWIGEIFPTTHAMRIVRGVLLKGNGTRRHPARAVADRGVHGGGRRASRCGAIARRWSERP